MQTKMDICRSADATLSRNEDDVVDDDAAVQIFGIQEVRVSEACACVLSEADNKREPSISFIYYYVHTVNRI